MAVCVDNIKEQIICPLLSRHLDLVWGANRQQAIIFNVMSVLEVSIGCFGSKWVSCDRKGMTVLKEKHRMNTDHSFLPFSLFFFLLLTPLPPPELAYSF